MKMTVMPIISSALGKKTGRLSNQRKNRDHLDHCTVKIDEYTGKNP